MVTTPPNQVVARVFFGGAIGAFAGVLVCLRMRTVSTRELWPWLVLPASGLMIGLVLAWRSQLIRRALQRWFWWFP